MSSEMARRLSAEASLARELTARGTNGVPAYTIVPKEVIEDKGRARTFLEQAGVAGVVVMRVVATDKEVVQTSGCWASGPYVPYYGSFWGGYWGYGWGAVHSPGTTRTGTILSVETLLYALGQDKLIWAGHSQTTNPSKLDKLMKELVIKAPAETRKAGLVRPQS